LPDDDDDPPGRVERARKYERAAAAKLRELITRSEELYAQAVRTLAAFEASLEVRRATLRRLGYLVEKGWRPRE
jgi:heme oxygenase